MASLSLFYPSTRADLYSSDGVHPYGAAGDLLHDEFAFGASSPGLWGNIGEELPTEITWSLHPGMGEGFDESEISGTTSGVIVGLSSFMPVGFKAQIELAFQSWSSVANLIFVEVSDDGADFDAGLYGEQGDIRFGGHVFDGVNGTLAHGFYPPVNGITAAGDIHFDISENWVIDSIGDGAQTKDIFQVAAHEIGHSLGLGHSFGSNSLMQVDYSESFNGPQADDIQGIQALYGAPMIPEPGGLCLWGGLLILWQRKVRRKSSRPPVSCPWPVSCHRREV